jgi:hypothetical protein
MNMLHELFFALSIAEMYNAAMLSMESSFGKKMDLTSEPTCVCVINFFFCPFQLLCSIHISHHFNFGLLFFHILLLTMPQEPLSLSLPYVDLQSRCVLV